MHLKLMGLLLVALVVASITTTPATMLSVALPVSTTDNEDAPAWARLNISLDTALDLAYTVRAAVEPLYGWAKVQLADTNITIHEKMWERGDYFLEKAENVSEVNETLATAYAFTASVFYSRELIAAHIILGVTIRENIANKTLTNETVEAVLARASELRSIVHNVSEDLNVTIPVVFYKLLNESEEKELKSRELLNEGRLGRAFSFAVRSYHDVTRAYAVLIKAIYAEKLGLDISKPRFLTMMLGRHKEDLQRRLGKLLERLPEHARQKIMEKVKRHHDIMELRKAIRETIREIQKRMKHADIKVIAKVTTRVILITSKMPTETGRAVRTWMREHNIKTPRELFDYILNLVNETATTYNVTGFKLLNITLTTLSQDIYNATGVQVDLLHIFYTMAVVHIHAHSGHHKHGKP
ncbi:hypothetical protein J4526_05990 [Desulfurococcaceae archaeon MEX13E-LK6-19]|nr:hypothetical protein J4526_05990 [Desulfurococcaceae archaeon MEX13E-LK6-19]